MAKKKSKEKEMFHIAEWYGMPFLDLSDGDRLRLGKFKASGKMLDKKEMQRIVDLREKVKAGPLTPTEQKRLADLEARLASLQSTQMICPFRTDAPFPFCNKKGGVCSMRLYQEKPGGGIQPVTGKRAYIRGMCPVRYQEDNTVVQHIGQDLLGDPNPFQVGEVGFLESTGNLDSDPGQSVGNIDMVLAATNTPQGHPMQWAAVEVQAVYFSGKEMGKELTAIANDGGRLSMPKEGRRPDYRSSGPKRFMPQLQIKVPTLRRWGKKMAVVVDIAFFESMGKMREVPDVSNCDIVWYIVDFVQPTPGAAFALQVVDRRLTTLEHSIEGLTGGIPVAKGDFEASIEDKMIAGP
ncbi:Restriction endonuclease NotI [Pseudooceanicola nitratireducens]|uniref:Restriction endonuclease NotI n=1 Tax=Pseudooceanicola nitratireducens TaxID=517719 RepID=A0A1I1MED5_9RHOB|nr:NotI family restriction endonuclease [Pseudooceanicola nitratireducens]SEI87383.1 Restriction endonuclease NotI [Pseudooceanicola nitratireducens]SFC83787.1 Restriction endonuclease NotI [Pseudooceanicola nitratireducens]